MPSFCLVQNLHILISSGILVIDFKRSKTAHFERHLALVLKVVNFLNIGLKKVKTGSSSRLKVYTCESSGTSVLRSTLFAVRTFFRFFIYQFQLM